MENIKITHIVVNANAGSEIEKCMAEAIKLAVTEWRNVHLFHNEKEYIVNVNDLLQVRNGETCIYSIMKKSTSSM